MIPDRIGGGRRSFCLLLNRKPLEEEKKESRSGRRKERASPAGRMKKNGENEEVTLARALDGTEPKPSLARPPSERRGGAKKARRCHSCPRENFQRACTLYRMEWSVDPKPCELQPADGFITIISIISIELWTLFCYSLTVYLPFVWRKK
jgi:hypothetical protein